jgi:hypothetical protein
MRNLSASKEARRQCPCGPRARKLLARRIALAPGIVSALLLSGCYAGIGPTVGIVTSSGTPTLGWELSGFTAAIGQSYAVRRASERPWRVRTYVAWEPRIGRPTRDLNDSSEAFGFAGLGGTLGARWEIVDDAAPPPRAQFLGGVWLGGGYAFPLTGAQSCGVSGGRTSRSPSASVQMKSTCRPSSARSTTPDSA